MKKKDVAQFFFGEVIIISDRKICFKSLQAAFHIARQLKQQTSITCRVLCDATEDYYLAFVISSLDKHKELLVRSLDDKLHVLVF